MIRRKVAERLQARRRGGSSGRQAASSLPSSSPDAVFSAIAADSDSTAGSARGNPRLDREASNDFLFVDDRDAQSDSGDDLEDHEALRQAVAGDEDEISGLDVVGEMGDRGELMETKEEEEREREEGKGMEREGEGEVMEDEPPPRSKRSPSTGKRERASALSTGGSGGGGGKGETMSSSKPALKPWQMTSDKEIYEQQLALMQEQLTNAMIEKEELRKELGDLKAKVKTGSRKELQNLVKENRELSKKLETATGQGASVGGVKGGASVDATSYGGCKLTVDETEDGFDNVNMSPDRAARAVQQRRETERKSVVKRIKEWFYDFLSDFTEEVSTGDEVEDEPALAAKKLKDNVQRLSRSSKPWVGFFRGVQSTLQWQRMGETLVVFLIYMYCVWNGWIMQIVAFLAIIKLGMNYLYTSGLAEQFGFPAPVRNFTPEELKFKDKIHVVRTVAQTCQNKSGQVSDALEKLENLFLWHHPAATQRLFKVLCMFLVMSLVLPNEWTLTLVGFGAGIKLFIIDNIYRKYPKVKAKYDTVARLWKELPTNEELLRRQAMTEEDLNSRTRRYVTSTGRDSIASSSSSSTLATSVGASSLDSLDSTHSSAGRSLAAGLTEEEISFCSRFQLSPEETPLSWWCAGRRCSLLDRSRPLSLTKSGKLYLTHSHLCFERIGRAVRDPERIIISLKLVKNVVKAKPFAVLPGSGMSIEVSLDRGDKFTFSAMLNRDRAYQSILDQGMILGLPWGSDPIGDGRLELCDNDDKEGDDDHEGRDGSQETGENA